MDLFTASADAPWQDGPGGVFQAVGGWLDFDTAVLGVILPNAPRPDAFLGAVGVDPALLVDWCAGRFRDDALLKAARRVGVAAGRSLKTRPGPPLPAMHAVVVMLPIGSVAGSARWWYLALGRRSRAFGADDQQRAGLGLRRLASTFDRPVEAALGRLVLGADGCLIAADPRAQAWWARDPDAAAVLRDLLPQVVEQRWPDLDDAAAHDVALDLAGRAVWVRFRRAGVGPVAGRGGGPRGGRGWYLELRPLGPDDLPAVGLVPDDRVARAMGYLSDHFAQAPSLTEVAATTGVTTFHFHRLFSAQAKISPKRYVLRTQLRMAKWLLRATRLPVGQVALATGFANHGHFTATFHKFIGINPTEYRSSDNPVW